LKILDRKHVEENLILSVSVSKKDIKNEEKKKTAHDE